MEWGKLQDVVARPLLVKMAHMGTTFERYSPFFITHGTRYCQLKYSVRVIGCLALLL